MTTKKWWIVTVVFAFVSAISFMQINSYWADQHHFNGFIGWLGIGLVTGAVAILGISKVARDWGGGDS